MDADPAKSHLQFDLTKEFNDSHVSYKFGAGTHNISMMQTLNSKLMGGFEMIYIVSQSKIGFYNLTSYLQPVQKEVHFCYGLNFNHDIHSFFAQYIPMARKETISLGYVGKPSRRLTLFSELKGSLDGFSDTLLGFRVKFLDGFVTGTFSSSFKATSTYRRVVENLIMLQFSSQIDFQKPEKPAVFGVSISLGGM